MNNYNYTCDSLLYANNKQSKSNIDITVTMHERIKTKEEHRRGLYKAVCKGIIRHNITQFSLGLGVFLGMIAFMGIMFGM